MSSKNINSRYKYFDMIKLGTTSKRKKNITVYFIYLCNNFLEKNLQKINYQLEVSSKNDNSGYKYLQMIKLSTTSKKKKYCCFFYFIMQKF